MKNIFSVLFFGFLFCVPVFSQEAVKIDEFSDLNCDEYLARMDGVINEAKNNPASIIYVFVYEGKSRTYNSRNKKYKLMLPVIGSVKAKINSMKTFVTKVRKFEGKNISFLEAGFREEPMLEFWIVPKNAETPKPTPTVKKMKYRKGKARGFCIGCCG